MAQHFLLSAAARTLSLKTIFSRGEAAAYRRFCGLRWPETDGGPVCPDCGCIEVYSLTSRRRFKCAACYRQFSVTSGTIFASRKLSFVDLLGAICLFVNASKGMSAVQLSRDLNVQYKTAFVLMHKLREAMAVETADTKLSNTVEIDGAYFGGHVRPANAKEDRVDRRLLENRTGKRRVVIALRERGGRTLTRAFLREAEGVDFARERIEPGAIVAADEVSHWDLLTPIFATQRINHSHAYSQRRCSHQYGGKLFLPASADDPRPASPRSGHTSRRLRSARRLARRPSLRKQWPARRSIDQVMCFLFP